MKPHIEALLEYSESMLDAATAAENTLTKLPGELRTESREPSRRCAERRRICSLPSRL